MQKAGQPLHLVGLEQVMAGGRCHDQHEHDREHAQHDERGQLLPRSAGEEQDREPGGDVDQRRPQVGLGDHHERRQHRQQDDSQSGGGLNKQSKMKKSDRRQEHAGLPSKVIKKDVKNAPTSENRFKLRMTSTKKSFRLRWLARLSNNTKAKNGSKSDTNRMSELAFAPS